MDCFEELQDKYELLSFRLGTIKIVHAFEKISRIVRQKFLFMMISEKIN